MISSIKTKLTLIFVLILLIVTTIGCDHSSTTYVSLTGTITIHDTSLPLKDAEIYLNGQLKDRSDEKGNFSISRLKPGKYQLVIKATGYETKSKEIAINEDGEILNIELEYIGEGNTGTVSGNVSISNSTAISTGKYQLSTVKNRMKTDDSGFNSGGTQYREGEVIVKYNNRISSQQKKRVDNTYNLNTLSKIERKRGEITRYRVPEDKSVKEMVALLEKKPEVEWAEPNYIYRTTSIPGDEKYEQQWGHIATNLEAAWEIEQGSQQVTVAVLDTGIIIEHEEFSYDTNVDRAGVSFAGESGGYNQDNPRNYAIVEDNPVDRTPQYLEGSHGTHVSGIIGAETNNRGIAGINWSLNLLPIKVLADNGEGDAYDIAEGIYYALDMGADIINLSLGGSEKTPLIHDALIEAYNNNIIIVAAAGNISGDKLLYPARYEECIGVGAVNQDLNRASYSHYGENLELVAPGTDILSSWGYYDNGNYYTNYKNMTGTSMSAAYVSGVAALLLANGVNPQDIRSRLTTTAVDLGVEGQDQKYGSGLVDAYAALLDQKLEMPYVFAATIEEENNKQILHIKSEVTTTDRSGNYRLTNIDTSGESLYIMGWRDVNKNFIVDSGDYFGKIPYPDNNIINFEISYINSSFTDNGLQVTDTSLFNN